ncbi:unnamed protein product [Ambrosiozyma monospora]|uniref:Unnamed protein product n=1 Tax=Ambrosiozyma monospora TaxID=43982 RepID=A0ACB5TQB6_AMBMO|nr:unnamed protein product [Ambrosiozyma monospora]
MPIETDTVISVSDSEDDSRHTKQSSSTPADIFRQFKIKDKLRQNNSLSSEEHTNIKQKQQNKDTSMNKVKKRKIVDNKQQRRKSDDTDVKQFNRIKRKKPETEYICDNDIAIIDEVEMEPVSIHEEMNLNDLTVKETPSVGSILDLNLLDETQDNLLKTGLHTPNCIFTDSDNILDQQDQTNNTSILELSHTPTPTEVVPAPEPISVPTSTRQKNPTGISICSILTGKKTNETNFNKNNNGQSQNDNVDAITVSGVSNKETPIEVEEIEDDDSSISSIDQKEAQIETQTKRIDNAQVR